MNTDITALKARARALTDFFKTRHITVNYQTSLDALSVLECGKDFNVLSSMVQNKQVVAEKHNGCNCKVCQNNRTFTEKLAELPQDKQGFFAVVYDDLLEHQADNDYMRCILEGKWPGAVEILESALKRAREARAESENKEE